MIRRHHDEPRSGQVLGQEQALVTRTEIPMREQQQRRTPDSRRCIARRETELAIRPPVTQRLLRSGRRVPDVYIALRAVSEAVREMARQGRLRSRPSAATGAERTSLRAEPWPSNGASATRFDLKSRPGAYHHPG